MYYLNTFILEEMVVFLVRCYAAVWPLLRRSEISAGAWGCVNGYCIGLCPGLYCFWCGGIGMLK
jgi:hypothetical protein